MKLRGDNDKGIGEANKDGAVIFSNSIKTEKFSSEFNFSLDDLTTPRSQTSNQIRSGSRKDEEKGNNDNNLGDFDSLERFEMANKSHEKTSRIPKCKTSVKRGSPVNSGNSGGKKVVRTLELLGKRSRSDGLKTPFMDLDRSWAMEKCEELTSWISGLLKSRGLQLNSDLKRCLTDGSTLPALTEISTGVALPLPSTDDISSLDTLCSCIKILREHQRLVGDIPSTGDLLRGDLKSVLKFLDSLKLGMGQSPSTKEKQTPVRKRSSQGADTSKQQPCPLNTQSNGGDVNTQQKCQSFRSLTSYPAPLKTEDVPGIAARSRDRTRSNQDGVVSKSLDSWCSNVSINVDSGQVEYDSIPASLKTPSRKAKSQDNLLNLQKENSFQLVGNDRLANRSGLMNNLSGSHNHESMDYVAMSTVLPGLPNHVGRIHSASSRNPARGKRTDRQRENPDSQITDGSYMANSAVESLRAPPLGESKPTTPDQENGGLRLNVNSASSDRTHNLAGNFKPRIPIRDTGISMHWKSSDNVAPTSSLSTHKPKNKDLYKSADIQAYTRSPKHCSTMNVHAATFSDNKNETPPESPSNSKPTTDQADAPKLPKPENLTHSHSRFFDEGSPASVDADPSRSKNNVMTMSAHAQLQTVRKSKKEIDDHTNSSMSFQPGLILADHDGTEKTNRTQISNEDSEEGNTNNVNNHVDYWSGDKLDAEPYDNNRCGTPTLPALTDNTDMESLIDSQYAGPRYQRSASASGNMLSSNGKIDTAHCKSPAPNSKPINKEAPDKEANRVNKHRSLTKRAGEIEIKVNKLEKLSHVKSENMANRTYSWNRRHSHSSMSSSQWSQPNNHYEHKGGKSRYSTYGKRTFDSRIAYKRFQRIESHIITLARSVAHLSSELTAVQNYQAELQRLTQEMHTLKLRMDDISLRSSDIASTVAVKIASTQRDLKPTNNNVRISKITRFFGQEPPLLEIFLRQLGYEIYQPKFDAEKVGMMELPYMTDDKLKYLGIPLGPRARILEEAANLSHSLPQIRHSGKTKKPVGGRQKERKNGGVV